MKTLMNRWVLALIVLAFLILKFFWIEIVEHAGENFQGAATVESGAAGLAMDDMKAVTGYKLAPLRNNPDQIRAERVHVVARSENARTLGFELVSLSPDNDYPSLRLTLLHRDGSKAREMEFAPSQYSHGRALASEQVELTVPVGEGESKAVVQPFYQPSSY